MSKNDIEAKMRAAQEQMSKTLDGQTKDTTKPKRKTVKEQYKKIKESLTPKAPESSFSSNYEELLKRQLFKEELARQKEIEDNEESEYYDDVVNPAHCHVERNGLWDYLKDDEIKYFDPEMSYELTGYRPINETEGLDFDPTPFCETGRIYTETGSYTEYPKGSKPYADFWREQLRRCTEGYTVGKYRITGDHYFFLNFYRMSIVDDTAKAASGDEESFPKFAVEQYKWFHYIEMCEYLKKDIVGLKARGVGFSEVAASLGVRPFITTRNYRTVYVGYTDAYVDGVLDKCWRQLNWLNNNTNGGMKRARQKIDNIKQKRASKVDKEGNEYGRMSEIEGIVADNPRKVRGDRCHRLMYEESGSNPVLRTSWVQGEALVTVAGARKGIRCAWGTGGDSDPKALQGLSEMFNDPEAFNVLPYKNNYSEDGTVQYTGFFLPAYSMMLKTGYTDNRGVTLIQKAKDYYETERKKKSGQVLLEYCAEYCFTPNEALLKQGDGIFDPILIADRLTQLRIQKIGIKPQRVDLLWDCPNADTNPRNKVKLVPNPQGKVFIYETPVRDAEGNPYKNLYVAGIDAIDQGTADSSTNNDVSDFCIVIKKRILGTSNANYVAIYKDRPRDIVTAYENAMKLLVYYNCKAMLEHTKIGIIMYFRSKKKDNLFMLRPKSTMPDIRKGNSSMIGYPATETYLRHGLELISRFVDEYCYSMQIDEMLEQLLKYSWENKRKFDIVAAMIAAELGDEDLLGFTPKVQNELQKVWKDFGWYYDSQGRKRYGVIRT